MKKHLIISICLALALIARAEVYLDMANLVSIQGNTAIFESTGTGEKTKDIEVNAQKALFHQLFYKGVDGINNGQPLVVMENKIYTNSFFNETNRYMAYVVPNSIVLIGKPIKTGNGKMVKYNITVRYQQLINDMKRNKVYSEDDINGVIATEVRETEGVVLPTVMVVPYKRDGESYSKILQNDYDRRIAVSSVQNGFESRNIMTVDLQGKLDAVARRAAYEQNAGTADSNDKQLLLTSGADVYVTVDINKDIKPEGSRVALILKAYETASGNILASKTATPTRRFSTSAVDALCKHTVDSYLQEFLDDIVKNFRPADGTRVVLQFAIAGTSMLTMNSPAGSHGYSISNIVRQWVRKNAYQGKYHLQGVMDESMIFDYVTIPPKDTDGLRMDAAQFGFILEQYLKEEENIDCSVRVDGNNILVTIE
jgi:hypothetical protein